LCCAGLSAYTNLSLFHPFLLLPLCCSAVSFSISAFLTSQTTHRLPTKVLTRREFFVPLPCTYFSPCVCVCVCARASGCKSVCVFATMYLSVCERRGRKRGGIGNLEQPRRLGVFFFSLRQNRMMDQLHDGFLQSS